MQPSRHVPSFLLVAVLAVAGTASADSSRIHVNEGSSERAIEIAQATVQAMGGWDALDATRFVSWNFFGRRQHYWDRHSGDIRVESERDGVNTIILMNIHTLKGRAFKDGRELSGDELAEMMENGHQAWVNDAYWMFMPYKLLDPGVTLKYAGERELEDGRPADVLDLTFADGVGYTPQNRYEIFVARDSGFVEQWAFFSTADETEPRFTKPWADWRKFARIWLATDHGDDKDWDIAIHAVLPRSVFTE